MFTNLYFSLSINIAKVNNQIVNPFEKLSWEIIENNIMKEVSFDLLNKLSLLNSKLVITKTQSAGSVLWIAKTVVNL